MPQSKRLQSSRIVKRSLIEFAVLRDEQELDAAVHVLEAVQIEARSPNYAFEGRGEKRWRVLSQLLYNVRRPRTELVRAGVAAITFSPDGPEILNHCPRILQRSVEHSWQKS